MTRALLLSITLGTSAVWDAAAQQLVPRPGFTEKRDRVVCGRMGCEAKTFYARPGCRRVQTGGFVGLPGAFKVVCGEKPVSVGLIQIWSGQSPSYWRPRW
jgi:hypothetical protein